MHTYILQCSHQVLWFQDQKSQYCPMFFHSIACKGESDKNNFPSKKSLNFFWKKAFCTRICWACLLWLPLCWYMFFTKYPFTIQLTKNPKQPEPNFFLPKSWRSWHDYTPLIRIIKPISSPQILEILNFSFFSVDHWNSCPGTWTEMLQTSWLKRTICTHYLR